MLCSDGLSGQLTDEELGAILQCLAPEEAVESMVDLANFRGGPDNITVIVAEIDSELPANVDFAMPADGGETKGFSQATLLCSAVVICLVLFAVCAMRRQWTEAIAAGIASAAALMAALKFRAGHSGDYPAARSIGGPYGNGPHRKVECPPNARVVASLSEIAAMLRELPNKEQTSWAADVDWQFFDQAKAMAVEASKNADYVTAIREYCRGIRNIMEQFREHRPTVDSSWNPL
jgi:protein phosphatase